MGVHPRSISPVLCKRTPHHRLSAVFLWLLLGITQIRCSGTRHHNALLSHLMDGYNINTRPVLNESQVVDVKIRIVLHQIREIDEKNQFVVTNVWIRFFWRDEFLQWEPTDHGGIDRMHVRSSTIWQPDIVLYNSVDKKIIARDFMADTNAELTPDGTVSWTAPALLTSSCSIKVHDYPFDVQNCHLKFGSWTYNGHEINVTAHTPHLIMDNFVRNGEWEVLDAPCIRKEVHYSCCVEPFPDITCTMTLRRLPLFYMYNLVFPCVMLIIVGGMVFILPPESGERISLAVTLLLAMTVFMLVIMENIPETSETVPSLGFVFWLPGSYRERIALPVTLLLAMMMFMRMVMKAVPETSDTVPSLEEFIGATIVLLALATVTSIIVVNFYHKGQSGKRPPLWVKRILNVLARLFCITPIPIVGSNKRKERIESPCPPSPLLANGRNRSMMDSPWERKTPEVAARELAATQKDRTIASRFVGGHQSLDPFSDQSAAIRSINTNLIYLRNHMHDAEADSEETHKIQKEWVFVVTVLDRLFLFLFFAVSITILVKVIEEACNQGRDFMKEKQRAASANSELTH